MTDDFADRLEAAFKDDNAKAIIKLCDPNGQADQSRAHSALMALDNAVLEELARMAKFGGYMVFPG
ncbi:hypothetical protein LCGC14_0513860 [marine sediment metagenome]|uniref:Uncharacterized protein n=1 Tax=marine sediment metagenome TaxID=412755 RepID=A0A0F9S592_9ZZZZ